MKHLIVTTSAENAFGLADRLRALADRFDRVGDVALPAPGVAKDFMFEGALAGTFTLAADTAKRSVGGAV